MPPFRRHGAEEDTRWPRGRSGFPDFRANAVHLNNIVEQDHRAIRPLKRSTPGFKSFWPAAAALAGIELMHMIREGQMLLTGELCPARQFHSLAE